MKGIYWFEIGWLLGFIFICTNVNDPLLQPSLPKLLVALQHHSIPWASSSDIATISSQ
jgi:hypothetical protein